MDEMMLHVPTSFNICNCYSTIFYAPSFKKNSLSLFPFTSSFAVKNILWGNVPYFYVDVIISPFTSRFFIIVVASFFFLLCHTSSSLSLCFFLLHFIAHTLINMQHCYIFSKAWCYVFYYASCCIFVFLHCYFASLHFGKNSCNVKATIVVVRFHLLLLILTMKIMVVYKYLISFVLLPQLSCPMFFVLLHVLLFFMCLILIFFLVLMLCLLHLKLVRVQILILIIWPLHLKFVRG